VSFVELFIRRPVATALFTVSIALLGVVAYLHLPIASLPNIERPTIHVMALLPGGSAETVESSLTTPLERQLGLISGLKEMHGSSIYGVSSIVLEFSLDKDIDAAATEVQAAIDTASTDLPKGMPGPPIYVKANPNGFPIIAIALTSDVVAASDVYQYADTVLAGKLSQIEGVAQVRISGAARPGVRIQINPRALADMNMSSAAVKGALLLASSDSPKGQIADGQHAVTLAANDQLMTADDYRNVIVAWKNGSPIKLRDVADIFDSTINDDAAGWFDSDSAVVLYVLKGSDANVVQTVDATLKLLPQFERWMPAGIKMHVLYNRTLLIRAAIADVRFTIAVSIVLVVLVLLMFLRRFWITVIPALTIPISIAGTLAVIYALGFSLDNISLLAVTIAVGFVIDDSVIIVENINRRVEAGEAPLDAAVKGTRQLGFTVISIAVALVAALIPILFMPDVVGRLFREFGLTLVAAIGTSTIVALTLTPMMCGQLMSIRPAEQTGRLNAVGGRIIAGTVEFYARTLGWTLRHAWLTLTVAVALTAASFVMYERLPKGFLPTQDTGILQARTLSRSNISFEAKGKSQEEIAKAIASDPAVEHVGSYIGVGPMSVGSMLVSLKPLEDRKESVERVIARLRAKLASTQDARVVFVPLQDLSIGAKKSASRYQYSLSGFNRDEVAKWTLVMKDRIAALPEATDVQTNFEKRGLATNFLLNRERAARAGITVRDIDNILDDWFGQKRLDLIRYPIDHARVVLETAPNFRNDPSDLDQVMVTSGIPTDILSKRRRGHAAMWVPDEDGVPSYTISFNTPPGVSVGQAVDAIREAEASAHLPDYIQAGFRGEARLADETTKSLPTLFLAAVVSIYIILGVLYESFAHPLTILSTLPSAAFGALLALILTHTDFTLIAAIGCILVVGIVMKNAIMLVDFALDAERTRGLPAREAILQAARLRFLPIIMTTMAALLGSLPLALGHGAGSELRQPLGIAIVGGLFLSQFVTLYTTPAVYLAVDRLRGRRVRANNRMAQVVSAE
jgi:hydrophobe/amphiphile efflux-1 (HAE1) family protein